MAAKKKENGKPMPAGFVPVRSRLDGFFTLEKGNSVTGKLLGTFDVDGKFGTKRVYRILVTDGTTIVGEDGEVVEVGGVIGLDEKGWLKSLGDLEPGTIVYVRYDGLGTEKSKKGNVPHTFTVGKAAD